jgi:hypothetical protein
VLLVKIMEEQLLESRLLHLETLVSKQSLTRNDAILSSLQSIQTKIRQITDERRALAEFLQKCGYSQLYVMKVAGETPNVFMSDSALRDLLHNQTNELDTASLDSASMKEIVLASEDEIIQGAAQLKDIDSLRGELDQKTLQC